MHCFDFVIIGAGSAGCVVANRLSARSNLKIALIEAGRDIPSGKVPSAISDPRGRAVYGSEFVWPNLHAARNKKEVDADIREYLYLQGKLVGGSSSVNAMLAMLPQPIDLEEWVNEGAFGWGFAEISPLIDKMLNKGWAEPNADLTRGIIPLVSGGRENWSPFIEAAASTIERQGQEMLTNLGTCFDAGVGEIPRNQTSSERVSAAAAYLTPDVRARENLEVMSNSTVTRLIFDENRIESVEIASEQGVSKIQTNNVVLCAGALNSPTLLMRSGIGPGTHLSNRGIEVVANIPGVGKNLHEHPTIGLAAHLKKSSRIDFDASFIPYVAHRRSSQTGKLGEKDILLSMRSHHGWHDVGRQLGGIHVGLYKPASRGNVELVGPQLESAPLINLNLLDDPIDRRRLIDGIRFAYELLCEPRVASHWSQLMFLSFPSNVKKLNKATAFNKAKMKVASVLLDTHPLVRDLLMRKLMNKGAVVEEILNDDHAISEWLDQSVYGSWHVGGTCRMGNPEHPDTVVDPDGRVIGLTGVWIADTSIMPTPIRATTNLMASLIGEKISEKIN